MVDESATFSSSALTRQLAVVKRAAARGPVLITERDAPAFVLVTIEELQRLRDRDRSEVRGRALSDVDGGIAQRPASA